VLWVGVCLYFYDLSKLLPNVQLSTLVWLATPGVLRRLIGQSVNVEVEDGCPCVIRGSIPAFARMADPLGEF